MPDLITWFFNRATIVLLPSFYNMYRVNFSKFVVGAMHLDIKYVMSMYEKNSRNLEKLKQFIFKNRRNGGVENNI